MKLLFKKEKCDNVLPGIGYRTQQGAGRLVWSSDGMMINRGIPKRFLKRSSANYISRSVTILLRPVLLEDNE
jgi:hypothetical protein